ncbi:MAG: DNA (cytosine-5-)-methyltransferase [Proteocatella sp.]
MPISVVELFAGVGGFRVGLENSSPKFKTIWANQWEPGKKTQHAFDCYVSHFGTSPNHVNQDISLVKNTIPPHNLLVGGFPCQDYSVARTGAKGIEGKKGVLWWEINEILQKNMPNYVLLENVDRLIKSPTSQRGRDFGIILRCLNDLDYAVEWRVINAAEYGQAQRRRRVFIFAYRKTTNLYKNLITKINSPDLIHDWIFKDGFFAPEFPVQDTVDSKKMSTSNIGIDLYPDLATLSNEFKSPLFNSGMMIKGIVHSLETKPCLIPPIPLKDVLLTSSVDAKYFLNGSTEKWDYLKGSKKILRKRPDGENYYYSEGGMNFPDNIDLPARTMLTSESSVNRSTHVVSDLVTGKLRLLTQVECERINGFPDNWTNTGMPEKFRYFVMGNALVVPIITKIGNRILEII